MFRYFDLVPEGQFANPFSDLQASIFCKVLPATPDTAPTHSRIPQSNPLYRAFT